MGWGLRPRLAALVAATGTVVAAAALGALVLVLGHQLDAAVDEGLRARADDLVAATVDGDLTASHHDPFAQVVASGGRVVAGSVNAPSTSVLDADELRAASRRPLTVDVERAGRCGAPPGFAPSGPDRTSSSWAPASPSSTPPAAGSLVVLGGSLVVLVALLTAGAWFLVGAALRPVARMSLAAEAMSDPHGQLPEARGHDELALLSRTLNGLLDRIGALLDRERAFLDDASHELRTPLTVLRGELELALEDPDPASVPAGRPGRADRGGAALGARERPARARAATRRRAHPGPDRRAAGRLARRLDQRPAGSAATSTSPSTSPTTSARRSTASRMERVLINLLNNAVAAGAERVRIRASRRTASSRRCRPAETTVIEVADDGPGFDPAILPRAFERFARAERGRSDLGRGSPARASVSRSLPHSWTRTAAR